MTKTHILIAALVIAHLLGTVLFGYGADRGPTLSAAVFFGLIFSQTSLLGMWAGLSMQGFRVRCVVMALGMLCTASALGLGLGELDVNAIYIVVVATFFVAFVTWIVRLIKVQLLNVPEGQVVRNEGLQFRIKHLFVLTTVVAILITTGKLLSSHLQSIMLTILAISFATVALTAIWAMLGSGRPTVRSVFVFLIAVATGCSMSYLADGSLHAFWIFMFVIQSVVMIVSLSVFRAIGFRIMAKQLETD